MSVIKQHFNRFETVSQKDYPEAKLVDLSLKKVRAFYKAAGIKYKVTQEILPNILKSLNLMSGRSINNAGVLFFAEKMDLFFLHSQVMLLAFKDYKGSVIFDRKEVRSDLLTQFNEAEFFLKRHMSLQGVIEGMKRRNVYEIPQEAWREAIANAIIHRDYRFGGTSIQVRVFPDRVEVISPGRLPKGVTPRNIGDMSSRRNEVIADMFARLDVIEKAGTGIIRIREAMEAENLQPPAFEDKGEFFKIILYRPKGVSSEGGVPRNVTTNVPRSVTTNVPRNVTTNDSKELNKTQLAILELVKKDRSITISEIASILILADRTIKRSIDFLKKSGLIQRIGSTKSGHWAVTDRSRK